jgi:NAD(P)-dependent dehydrogenase (short-subunit alcohol dehydrogenase family)
MTNAFKNFDLTGRTAVVTGGATGLGYHMTRALASSGARVLICSRRESILKSASEQLNRAGFAGSVSYYQVDLATRASIGALTKHALSVLGGVDIYIGNAAIDCLEHLENIKDESIDAMCQVNISANIELLRAFLPHMRRQKWGRVMFTSSATTICASPHEGAGMYSAVKGALNTFTRTAAVEVGHDGITVNSLVLGMYLTDMVRDIFSQADKAHGAGAGTAAMNSFACMTALGRLGECEEIEGLVQLLASDAGRYITGTNLVIDGGMSIMLRPNMPTGTATSSAGRSA